MKKLCPQTLKSEVKRLIFDGNCHTPDDYFKTLKNILEDETDDVSKAVMSDIVKNNEMATDAKLPICQDTGIVVVFLEIGRNLLIDFDIYDKINEAIAESYIEYKLRLSVVGHPLERINTKNNTPAIFHTKLVAGDNLKVTVCPKGAGSENMSKLAMLTPASGRDGVVDFIIETVKAAGPNACPPITVGVGIGGNFEVAPYLAKEALIRPIGTINPNGYEAELEAELLEKINALGIGPMGLGGKNTAVAVHVNTYPCHIASLPVAVNIQCHVNRHESVVL